MSVLAGHPKLLIRLFSSFSYRTDWPTGLLSFLSIYGLFCQFSPMRSSYITPENTLERFRLHRFTDTKADLLWLRLCLSLINATGEVYVECVVTARDDNVHHEVLPSPRDPGSPQKAHSREAATASRTVLTPPTTAPAPLPSARK